MINSVNDRDTSEAITIARTPAMAWLENHQRTATQSTYHPTFHMFHSTPSSCGISQSQKTFSNENGQRGREEEEKEEKLRTKKKERKEAREEGRKNKSKKLLANT